MPTMSDNGTPYQTWPEAVQTDSHSEMGKFVRLTGLPDRLRRVAWAEINANSPELAELLKDPSIKAVIEMFDANLFVEPSVAPSLPPERLRSRSGG